MKKTFVIIGAVILLTLLVIVIKNSHIGENQNIKSFENKIIKDETAASVGSVGSVQTGQAGSSQSSPFTVNGGNYYFKPNIIKVKQGDKVTIKFINDNGMHNFIVDEFNVGTQMIKGGAEETISFVADKKGSFEYYCSVGQHRQNGMKGTLIVE